MCMEKVIELIKQWNYISALPKECWGFQLSVEMIQRENQYGIFSYQNKEEYKKFSVLYDNATKEFLVRITRGLTEYCDVNFITPDLKHLEGVLQERQETALKHLAVFDQSMVDSIVLDKKILDWEYGKKLPQEICGFSLYIRPDEPVKVINGSYIIVDYSDFFTESNLIIYYNMFRDEFFGEIRLKKTPQMTSVFDSRTLEDLGAFLETHLSRVLESMREMLRKSGTDF